MSFQPPSTINLRRNSLPFFSRINLTLNAHQFNEHTFQFPASYNKNFNPIYCCSVQKGQFHPFLPQWNLFQRGSKVMFNTNLN